MVHMAFNQMRELEAYVNEKGIKKEDIVDIFQTSDKLFMLVYYER